VTGHIVTTPVRIQATGNIGCLPSFACAEVSLYPPPVVSFDPDRKQPTCLLLYLDDSPTRPSTTPARLGYLHTVGAIGSWFSGAPPPPSPQAISLTALVFGPAQQPNPDFFFLLVRSAPNEGWSCAEPGSSLQGPHLRSTSTATRAPVLTFTYIPLFTLLVLTYHHPIEVFNQLRLSAPACLSLLKAALTQ
jgi:hypothetical protein